MKNNNSVINVIINIAVTIVCICIVLVFFVDLPFLPSWSDITGEQAEIDSVIDEVVFLDVGEGDATLIKSNGRYALIDTGDGSSYDVANKLKRYGVKGLDALILTHWHDDHIGEATEILEEFPVLNLIIPDFPATSEDAFDNAIEIRNTAEENDVSYYFAEQGLVINIGDFRFSVLYHNPEESDENNRSVILMGKCRDKKFLFMADAETSIENILINDGYNLDCDVIKIGHHGSKTSTSKNLIKVSTPQYAVISVGRNNQYNHPSNSVLDSLHYSDVQILRTDRHGEIELTVGDDDIKVNVSIN